MTEVHPSVSTDGRLRTMAFFLAILLVPSARQVVMTAGRPGKKKPKKHRKLKEDVDKLNHLWLNDAMFVSVLW